MSFFKRRPPDPPSMKAMAMAAAIVDGEPDEWCNIRLRFNADSTFTAYAKLDIFRTGAYGGIRVALPSGKRIDCRSSSCIRWVAKGDQVRAEITLTEHEIPAPRSTSPY